MPLLLLLNGPARHRASWRRHWGLWCGLLAFCWGCAPGKPAEPQRTAAPVTIAAAEQKDLPVELRTIGTVQPYATVSIRSRVSGQIMSVGFREGQDVKQGDLLFTIDRRPLEAALAQADANRDRDVANQKNAENDLVRYQGLFDSKTITEEQFEQVRTKAEALRATVAADQAAVRAAAVMLEYTTIRSPLSGRTGDLLVDEGNIVKADDAAPLVVINQVTPIYVGFSAPEQYLPEIRNRMDEAQRAGREKLDVEVLIPNDLPPVRGKLEFIDNSVNRATGTIQLKATFSNQDKRLWPGQFVDVVMLLSRLTGATVVPSQAIQTGQRGQYVFVVKSDETVEMRDVTARIEVRGETAVLEKELAPGERVVTDGQLSLSPGVKVIEKKAAAASQEKAP